MILRGEKTRDFSEQTLADCRGPRRAQRTIKMSLLPGRRCARVYQALLLAVVLLAGQRSVLGEVVAGAAAASQDAVDSKVGCFAACGTCCDDVWAVHGGAGDQDGSITSRAPTPYCRRASVPRRVDIPRPSCSWGCDQPFQPNSERCGLVLSQTAVSFHAFDGSHSCIFCTIATYAISPCRARPASAPYCSVGKCSWHVCSLSVSLSRSLSLSLLTGRPRCILLNIARRLCVSIEKERGWRHLCRLNIVPGFEGEGRPLLRAAWCKPRLFFCSVFLGRATAVGGVVYNTVRHIHGQSAQPEKYV